MMQREKEDMCFMSHENINIVYKDLINNYQIILDYLGKNSNLFSFITRQQKPYSKIPPNCEHDHVLQGLAPYLVKKIVGVQRWPGTITRDTHRVMCVYRSCKEARAYLKTQLNLFAPLQYNLPEDICFYRQDQPWFVTVSHEHMAFMSKPTKYDIEFLSSNSIRYI